MNLFPAKIYDGSMTSEANSTTSLLLSPMATKQDTAWSLLMLAYTLPVQTLQLQGAFLLSSFQELEVLWKEYQGINKMFMNVADEKANLRESQTQGNKRSTFHICTSTH